MFLLLYISLGFAAISISLLVFATLGPELKRDVIDAGALSCRTDKNERQMRSST